MWFPSKWIQLHALLAWNHSTIVCVTTQVLTNLFLSTSTNFLSGKGAEREYYRRKSECLKRYGRVCKLPWDYANAQRAILKTATKKVREVREVREVRKSSVIFTVSYESHNVICRYKILRVQLVPRITLHWRTTPLHCVCVTLRPDMYFFIISALVPWSMRVQSKLFPTIVYKRINRSIGTKLQNIIFWELDCTWPEVCRVKIHKLTIF